MKKDEGKTDSKAKVKKTAAQIEAERIRKEEEDRIAKAAADVFAKDEEAKKVAMAELDKLKNAPPIEAEEEPDFSILASSADSDSSAANKADDDDVPDSWDALADDDDEEDDTASKAVEQKRVQVEQDRLNKIALWKAEQAARIQKLTSERTERIRELEKMIAAIHERRRQAEEQKKAEEEAARQKKLAEASAAEDAAAAALGIDRKKKKKVPEGELRSPICAVLGHVDTGKTKLLDKIRHTNVQDNEASGITQQIGCTFLPSESVKAQTSEICATLKRDLDMRVPGLLVIDTPGHESFTNLRSRGSGLCDIAILVIDIMVGLEQQTLESIGLLKQRKTPFVIALNKVDRIHGWKATPSSSFQSTYDKQDVGAKQQFETLAGRAMLQMSEQGLNTQLWFRNTDFRSYVSIIPTSAITGEGVPDLLMLLVQLTQTMMNERLTYVTSLQCTVLEVKPVEGYGTTLDVILVNGVLNEGDTIVVCGLEGPIVTSVRALLTPPPNRELRVKSEYFLNKSVKAAMGVKIAAAGLENAIPGSQLLVCGPRDDVEELKDEVQGDLQSILSRVDKSGRGVYVQASTLGSMEALLAFLADIKISVSGISIGPVHKKDVMRAAVMLEHQPEFALILAFDVKINTDAKTLADKEGVKILSSDTIYKLKDMADAYMKDIKQKARDAAAGIAVFPVVLDIFKEHVFNIKSPIVIGCKVVDGILRVGTPLCVPSKDKLFIGRVESIEKNHEEVKEAKKGEEVAVKISDHGLEHPVIYGRHFDYTNQLVSLVTRNSIDLLKANFKDDLEQSDWALVLKLKKIFDII